MGIASMKKLVRLLIAVLLALGLAFPLPLAADKVKETPQGKQWPMKYEAGDQPIKHDTKLKVTVGRETIVCELDKGGAFSIPVAQVVEVSYDSKVRRRVTEGAIIAATLSLGVGAVVAALVKTKKHFVNVIWEEEGKAKEVILKVGKGEYAGFLADLQRVTGKEWKNLETHNKQIQEELKREKNKRVTLQLDRAVKVGDINLTPGLYQLVYLERQGSQGELYFFAGKEVNTKKIAAVALVEEADPRTGLTSPQVIYQEDGGVVKISEIRTPGKTFRFL